MYFFMFALEIEAYQQTDHPFFTLGLVKAIKNCIASTKHDVRKKP